MPVAKKMLLLKHDYHLLPVLNCIRLLSTCNYLISFRNNNSDSGEEERERDLGKSKSYTERKPEQTHIYLPNSGE